MLSHSVTFPVPAHFLGQLPKWKLIFPFSFFRFSLHLFITNCCLVCIWHLHWQHKCANILNPLAPHCFSPSLSLCFCSALYPFSGYLVSLVYIAIITLTYRSTICAIYQSNSTSKLIIIIKFSEKFFSFSSTNWLTDICRSQLTDRQSILYSVLFFVFLLLFCFWSAFKLTRPTCSGENTPKTSGTQILLEFFFWAKLFFCNLPPNANRKQLSRLQSVVVNRWLVNTL